MTPPLEKYSCVSCARRKVRCNKVRPCSNCAKAQSECTYPVPVPSQRHRKRPADGDLQAKVSEYENLLREHNIKFDPLDTSWIPSPLAEKLAASEHATAQSAQKDSASQVQEPKKAEGKHPEPEPIPVLQPKVLDGHGEAAQLWFALPKDLRDPPIEQLRRPGKDAKDPSNDTNYNSSIVLLPVNFTTAPDLRELHPEPKHVFKLWQTFTEKVNPLTKIIHTPSLQQRILEVSWNLEAVTKPLEAIMFGVYALAVVSMKGSDCVETFGETKSVLLNRYRSGAAQALIAAGLHTTRDLEVLQALILFALVDPRSDSATTLYGMAIRIGHKMGIHRTEVDPKISFFEQEMRLRVWWLIRCLDKWARSSLGLRRSVPRGEFGDIRLPLNVNDADLHPHMTGPPVSKHVGPTEMLYCMMRYEVVQWIITSPTLAGRSYDIIRSTTPDGMEWKRTAIAELEQLYEEKFLSYCDVRIPLHHITATMARLLLHRSRFNGYQPRHQPDAGRHMSPAEEDRVFETALGLLELDCEVRTSGFSMMVERLVKPRLQIDALVYILSELRRRVRGPTVRAAWAQVARMHEDHPELVQGDGNFYTALADLTLEAWEARWRELRTAHGHGPAEEEEVEEAVVPGFITALQVARMKTVADSAADMSSVVGMEGMVPGGNEQFWFGDDEFVDWASCNEYFQF